MDAVFQALAHAGRRRILDILKDQPGHTVGQVCECFDTSRIAVLKNLRVLTEARLISSQKVGRTRRLFLNAVPIRMIYERWMTAYSTLWAERLTRIKYTVESEGAEPREKKAATRPQRKAGRKRKDQHDG
jgi:DNA-binding transcriptional ArsR family regulator